MESRAPSASTHTLHRCKHAYGNMLLAAHAAALRAALLPPSPTLPSAAVEAPASSTRCASSAEAAKAFGRHRVLYRERNGWCVTAVG